MPRASVINAEHVKKPDGLKKILTVFVFHPLLFLERMGLYNLSNQQQYNPVSEELMFLIRDICRNIISVCF